MSVLVSRLKGKTYGNVMAKINRYLSYCYLTSGVNLLSCLGGVIGVRSPLRGSEATDWREGVGGRSVRTFSKIQLVYKSHFRAFKNVVKFTRKIRRTATILLLVTIYQHYYTSVTVIDNIDSGAMVEDVKLV